MKNSGRKMSVSVCRKIIEKAAAEGAHSIGFYNWAEPFLVPDLCEYVSAVKESGLSCDLSSNLSFENIKNLDTVLASGVDRLIVSVSGFDQNIYEINHVGGNIAWVKDNLKRISGLKKNGVISGRVDLRLIRFDYNEDQEKKLRDYAAELGLGFEVINGAGDPLESGCAGNAFLSGLKNASLNPDFQKDGETCSFIFDHIALDPDGDVFLCCAKPNDDSLKIGAYLDLSKEEILRRRYTHPMCAVCKVYGQRRRKMKWIERRKIKEAFMRRAGSLEKKDGGMGAFWKMCRKRFSS